MGYNDLRVLRLFLTRQQESFSVKDVSKELDVGLTGVYWIVKGLIAQNFIIRVNGYPAHYKINDELFKKT